MFLKTIGDLAQRNKTASLIVYFHSSVESPDRQFGILVWTEPYTDQAYDALCKWRKEGIIRPELWDALNEAFWKEAHGHS